MPDTATEGPRIVLSPHLDDAVLCCGQWMVAHPGAIALTIFAGMPQDRAQRTEWDTQCGFERADDAMRARWEEDRQALSHVHATPLWLDFCDHQYQQPVTPRQVADALVETLRGLAPREVLAPFGIFHPDHLLTHAALTLAMPELPGIALLAYEDAVYRAMPGLLQQRLAAFAAAGIVATPADDGGVALQGIDRKRRAIDCYASQLLAIPSDGLADAWQPERFWRLEGGPFSRPQRLHFGRRAAAPQGRRMAPGVDPS